MSKQHDAMCIPSLRRFINVRPFSIFTLGVICGILSGIMTHGIKLAVVAAITVMLTACAVYYKRRVILFAAVGIVLGIISVTLSSPIPGNSGNYSVSGRVYSIDRQKITISDIKLNDAAFNKSISIYRDDIPDEYSPDFGDWVEFSANIEFVSADLSNTYGFYQLSHGIGAEASGISRITVAGHDSSLSDILHKSRDSIGERIDSLFGQNAPFVRGVLLGDTSYMEDSDLDALRASGLAHILALSGLHVSIIAGLLNLLLRKAEFRIRLTVVTAFLFLYAALVNFPPSLVRAGIMTEMIMLQTPLKRRYDSLSALAFAAFVVLAINPYELFTAGFLMSFSAVLGIIFLSPMISNALEKAVYSWLAGSISVSLSANLGVLPPMMVFFQNIAIYGPIVNPIAIPIASVGIVTAFLGTLLDFIWHTAAIPFAYITNAVLDLVNLTAHAVASLPHSVVFVKDAPIIPCLLLYALMFSASDYLMVNTRTKVWILIALTCICVVLCMF